MHREYVDEWKEQQIHFLYLHLKKSTMAFLTFQKRKEYQEIDYIRK